ncbi:MAG TPA: class II aldolase/adducin family protein [Candidatus Baltobacteraceae bacterium]|nr:class II aldolase/adducin family protein [Candidatus Baltobacteraceae bacterium]
MTATAARPDLRSRIGDAEWATRVELAAAYRLVALYGWDDLIYTHISARVPGTEDFLINPYGMLFEEIRASDLVKVDLEGNVLEETPYPVNPAGFTIHSAVHSAREDVGSVLHLHTVNGVAVSCHEAGLLPLNQTAMLVREEVAYHEYEGVAFNLDERPRLIADLGTKSMMLLRNHGTLTTGRTVGEAFHSMYYLERACAMQVAALAGGTPLHHPSEAVQRLVTRQAQAGMDSVARLAWQGLIRKLDREQPDYKT